MSYNHNINLQEGAQRMTVKIQRLVMCKLDELKAACCKVGVGFSLTYEESSSEYYCCINSAAKEERFVGKSRSGIEIALTDGIGWAKELDT